MSEKNVYLKLGLTWLNKKLNISYLYSEYKLSACIHNNRAFNKVIFGLFPKKRKHKFLVTRYKTFLLKE